MHVTLRLRAGLPSLRRPAVREVIERAIARGSDRLGLRVVHYSIQTNHLHVVAEASDRQALSRGLQGLSVRLARALNKLSRRKGKIFADRFHARCLRTPREVRCAIVYVLHNARRHGVQVHGPDEYSSGLWFDGWTRPIEHPERTSPVAPAKSWLLGVGWRRHGLIGPDESPGPSRAASARDGIRPCPKRPRFCLPHRLGAAQSAPSWIARMTVIGLDRRSVTSRPSEVST